MSQSSAYPPKKTIYLVRHGQTDYNLRKIVQGSGIDSELNDTGHAQARAFYESYGHIDFDAIYVSELKRTHQSVAPFVSENRPLHILAELNEINWGTLEGKEPTPERYNHFLETAAKWKKGDYSAAVDGGESIENMTKRQQKALEKIMSDPHETILVCMHGRAIRTFLCLLTQEEFKNMDKFPHENLGLYILEHETNQQFKTITFNNTQHLEHL